MDGNVNDFPDPSDSSYPLATRMQTMANDERGLELQEESSPTNQLLHAVHGFSDGSRIAVGGSFEGPPPWAGVILEDLG